MKLENFLELKEKKKHETRKNTECNKTVSKSPNYDSMVNKS